MREETAQRALLIRAIEEADQEGRLLTPQERVRATVAAQEATAGDRSAVIEWRTDHLIGPLSARTPWVGTLLRLTGFPAAVIWLLPLAAAAAGLLADALGPERRINILSVPLLGLIAWNLCVYAGLMIFGIGRLVRGRPSPEAGTTTPRGGVSATLAAWAEWRGRRLARAGTQGQRLGGQVVSAFLTRWQRLVAPLFALRVRLLLHLGAALLAVGILGGAYWRGIAFEYQATWESTFLGPGQVRALLVLLLGPAGLLLGEPIPSVETLAALRAPGAGEAAPWVHRYALTTFLIVIVPRLLLAGVALLRARWLAAHLPVDLDDPYFRRLLAGTRPLAHVDVLPYGTRLAGLAEETLRRLLRALAGATAEVRLAPGIPYGADPAEILAGDTAGPASGEPAIEWWRALVFSLAQSPEDEAHGELLAGLVGWVAADGRRRGLALVDASPYRARLAGTGVEVQRIADRQRAWDRVAERAGASLVHLDLETAASDDQVVARIQDGMWPALAAGRSS